MLRSKIKPKKDINALYKLTRHVRGLLVVIWLTLVAYIVYTEWYNVPLSVLGV